MKSQCLRPFLALRASLVAQRLKCLPARWETWVQSLGQEDPLEKEMATHSSILAWRIPWMEEPGGLQSKGLQRVDMTKRFNFHFLALKFSFSCKTLRVCVCVCVCVFNFTGDFILFY